MLDPEIAPGTYSIVAVDPERGDAGCAVESRYFSVGAVCAWVRPGVGAVTTQSNANLSYGPRGLDLLASDVAPEQVISTLTGDDELREQRQAAVINMRGDSARWTGREANPWCGSRSGKNYSCQGNLLTGPQVIDRMAEAFEAAEGEELGERLMRALEAAEAAGGDLRGSQSAVLLVTRWDGRGEPPVGLLHNLRVDEHRDPIGELRRMLNLKRAYGHAGRARALARAMREGAEAELEQALTLGPEDDYLRAIAGEVEFRLGHRDQALEQFRKAVGLNPKARCYLTLFGADRLYDESFRREVLE